MLRYNRKIPTDGPPLPSNNPRSWILRTQKLNNSQNPELKGSPFKAWNRSEYSHVCFTYCQGFLLLIPTLPIHSPAFFPKPLPFFSASCGYHWLLCDLHDWCRFPCSDSPWNRNRLQKRMFLCFRVCISKFWVSERDWCVLLNTRCVVLYWFLCDNYFNRELLFNKNRLL